MQPHFASPPPALASLQDVAHDDHASMLQSPTARVCLLRGSLTALDFPAQQDIAHDGQPRVLQEPLHGAGEKALPGCR